MLACRTCDSDSVTPISGSNQPLFGICGSCGSLQSDELFDRSSMAGMDIYGDTKTYPQFCLTLGQRIFRSYPLIRYLSPGRMFQVEANDGYLGATWLHRGWTVEASSLSGISAKRAAKLGINIIVGMPSELIDRTVDPYDTIVTEMGYCRFPSPLGELSVVLPRLRVGGALLIHGPNPASSDLLAGVHGHLNRLNLTIPHPNAIVRFCERENMVLVERREDGPDMALIFVRVR